MKNQIILTIVLISIVSIAVGYYIYDIYSKYSKEKDYRLGKADKEDTDVEESEEDKDYSSDDLEYNMNQKQYWEEVSKKSKFNEDVVVTVGRPPNGDYWIYTDRVSPLEPIGGQMIGIEVVGKSGKVWYRYLGSHKDSVVKFYEDKINKLL